ncbi:hypothetical protein [Streptosporangium lutulentum]|uniref:Uncharacterized protein n=1 Tax=Streptosporangium lutulentum TaxID=1461250 RepID=A0ABT9QWL6_9ACTN|nr:hypothetical protein [Streptosporangium lutulentum]MDP9850344.1 hypothetical protein [Streptosporangium lutulentum]
MQDNEQLADWQKELEGLPVIPQDTQEEPLPAEWAALNTALGGTVNLAGVWEPIRRSPGRQEDRGHDLVEQLEQRTHGRPSIVARRLGQVLEELISSDDGKVHMDIPDSQGGVLNITAWCWDSVLPWWFHADLKITVGPVTLVTSDWDSDAITYIDEPEGPIGHVMAGWLIGWVGRLGIQGYAGLVPESDELPELVTQEEFATQYLR